MRVALSIPVELDDAVFEFAVPTELAARFLPAAMLLLSAAPDAGDRLKDTENEALKVAGTLAGDLFALLPDEAQAAVCGGEPTDSKRLAVGLALMDEGNLKLLAEVFETGVVEWKGVEAGDGSRLACSEKNRAALPLMVKVAASLIYAARLRDLHSKKESAT